jgi:hypothetical protein
MLRMVSALPAAGLLAATFLSGCSVVALHPVAGDAAQPYDARIAGMWQPVGETNLYRITQADDTTYRYCELKDSGNECGKVQLITAGSEVFADLAPDGGIVPLHVIARVSIAPDEIRLAILQKVDPKTTLRYEILGKDKDKQTVFTASTAELQAALPKLAVFPGAFGDEAVLRRMKATQ